MVPYSQPRYTGSVEKSSITDVILFHITSDHYRKKRFDSSHSPQGGSEVCVSMTLCM
uniref:Uncharacterized protein n=1 Tax=Anguilla anguilla TaxID=7936 RepID=A0A0E9R0G9_ANGAN